MASDLNFQAGCNTQLTVAAGDTLIVENMIVSSGCNITISGVLVINGNFTNTGGVTMGNVIVVKGNLDNSGGAINNGTIYTFGTVTNAGAGSLPVIGTATIPHGMYFVVCTTQSGIFVEKIIIE